MCTKSLILVVAAGAALGACSTPTTVSRAPEPPRRPMPIVTALDPEQPFDLIGLNVLGEPQSTGAPARVPETADTGFEAGISTEPAEPLPYDSLIASTAASTASAREGGANLTRVSFASDGADFDPDVSRDGRTIVFASTQHRPKADIYSKSVDGRTVTQLTNDPGNDVMPKISPDGTRIAFASNRGGSWDIFVMPITGGRAALVTGDPSHELHPSWSPDGSSLVYCRLGETSGKWEIWVTEVANTGIASFIGYGLFPEWCPESGTGEGGTDRIVFQKSRERGDRAFGVWTLDYKDGKAENATEIAAARGVACINPSWSPDGRWIAYATVPASGIGSTGLGGASADLWITSVDGVGTVNLAAGRATNLMPCWGANDRIFFISDRGGSENIWSLDAGGAVLAATGASPAEHAGTSGSQDDGAVVDATVQDDR